MGMGPIQNCKLDLYQFYTVKFYVMNQNWNQCDPGLDSETQQNFLATAWHWTVNRICFNFAKTAMCILVYDATAPVTELHRPRTFFTVSLKLAILQYWFSSENKVLATYPGPIQLWRDVIKLLGQAWASPTLARLHCAHACVCLLACGHIP